MSLFTSSRVVLLLLILVLGVGFGLRVHRLGQFGLAGDEKYSLFVSQFIAGEGANQPESVRKPGNAAFTPAEFHSPKDFGDFQESLARAPSTNALHPLLLHYWTKVFGLSDFSLRFPSVLFGVALVGLLFLFVKVHIGTAAQGLAAAGLAAISPLYVCYSQLFRNYALLFFLSLLALHLLLLVARRYQATGRPAWGLLAGYGVVNLLCILTNYTSGFALVLHGLLVLGCIRPLALWKWLALSMVIPAAGLALWLQTTAGQFVFHSIEVSRQSYNLMAEADPQAPIAFTSVAALGTKLPPVVLDGFILTEGLAPYLLGTRNLLLALVTVGLVLGLWLAPLRNPVKIAAYYAVLAGSSFLYSVNFWAFGILVANAVLLLVFLGQKRNERMPVWFITLAAWVPYLFLVVFAFQDGNTFRITSRYVAYAYAFGLVLSVLMLWNARRLPLWFSAPLLLACVVQTGRLPGRLDRLYTDQPTPYFHAFSQPRVPNPYQTLAAHIQWVYAPGDTVIYPANVAGQIPGGVGAVQFSVIDAQLTNFYLPKTAQFLQRTNPAEPNKVWLRRATGKNIQLFDFKGLRYRY